MIQLLFEDLSILQYVLFLDLFSKLVWKIRLISTHTLDAKIYIKRFMNAVSVVEKLTPVATEYPINVTYNFKSLNFSFCVFKFQNKALKIGKALIPKTSTEKQRALHANHFFVAFLNILD